jgi:glycosyltransferase involved in cell wall biosynthesis
LELISPLKTALRWAYLPHQFIAKIANRHFSWENEDRSLRYFAAQVQKAVGDKKLDVVFATSTLPVAKLKGPTPVVFWSDSAYYTMVDYYPRPPMTKRARRKYFQTEEAAVIRANFACYSSHWAADAAARMTDPSRVKVLPFGPNLPIEHNQDDVQRWICERRQGRPQSCTLLFVGKEWERKGGPTAVETARRLNQAGIVTTLKVVGCNPAGTLPPFVELAGFIDKREAEGRGRLAELYRTSDIFIMPSRQEAFGVVVSEAAAFGLPAVVTDTGGLAETVREGATGFRVPVDDDGSVFAERVMTILRDYESFARNAYAEFQSRLNWQTSVDMLVDLLQRAAKHER